MTRSKKQYFHGQPLISFQGELVFQKRSLNHINTAIETHFYARLNFYRTPIKRN